MIAQQFLTAKVVWWCATYVVLCLAFSGAAWYFNRKARSVEFSAGSFREPIGHLMSTVGLLLPIVIGAIAFLVDRGSAATVSTLLAAVAILFVAFLVASWLTFALVSRSDADDKIKLDFPKDWPYRAASGVVYTGLMFGVAAIAWFFLFEFNAKSKDADQSAVRILIDRPAARVGQDRGSVRTQLGEAQQVANGGNTWTYKTDRSTLRIDFDLQGNVIRVTEEK